MLEIRKNWKLYLVCSLLGAISFLAIFGVEILNPLNDGWLLGEGSDLTQHYIGWTAYRQSAWSFPVGCADDLAYPFRTSVIFTDSIPLFAVTFKLFSPILPETFQYFGIYGLLCYILQAFFASVILKKYLPRQIDIILGSMFFVLSPVMLARMYYHTSLASHFLILLTILSLVYYEETFSRTNHVLKLSTLTAFLASSIHIYLLAMCAMIWCAYCVLDILKTKKAYRSIYIILTFGIVSLVTVWLLGGLNGVFAPGRGGLGSYGLNLNAFINSQGNSVFLTGMKLPDIDVSEGYAYLGVGMLVFLAFDVIVAFRDMRAVMELVKRNREKVTAIVLLGIIVFLFSVLPAVYLNDKLLLEIKFPQLIQKIWGIFRATGRFSWIIYYICFAAVIIFPFLLKGQKRGVLTFVLAVLLMVQLYDITPQIAQKRSEMQSWDRKKFELSDSCWDELVQSGQVKHVYFGFSDMETEIIYPVTEWAVTHGMTVNRFYFARSLDKETVADLLGEAMWEKAEDSIFIFRPEDREFCEKNGFFYVVTEENLLLAGKSVKN